MIVSGLGQIAPKAAHDHGGVFLVSPRGPGVELIQNPQLLRRAGVRGAAGPRAGRGDARRGGLRARPVSAGHSGGVRAGRRGGGRALALTRDHVASREQFGRPLAAFQAVSQQIADVYIASRTMHLAALSACWRLAEGREAAADLEVAGYWCAEQAPRSVRLCHHLHGGIGMDAPIPCTGFPR